MEGLFDFLNVDFLHDLLSSSWFDDVHHHFGAGLTDDVIVQSVQEASEFFNMSAPKDIHEGWTTGVMTRMAFTENDDILVFNREQLHEMGITDKEGFDLVMTHEGAHRALQGLDTGFSSHQEELCCDYLAGIRAGLNGMEEGKLEACLAGTVESLSHPDGAARVAAIESGVAFAHEYMEAHNGVPPTFSECLEHFSKTDAFADTLPQEPEHINLRPEPAPADSEEIKGIFIDDRAAQLRYAKDAKENAEWHEKRSNDAIARGDLSSAKDHADRAASYRRAEKEAIEASKKCTK